MRKLIVFILIILNIITLNCYAISAQSSVLIDGTSGRILYENNAYSKMPMASTTKIMTGLLACESGKLDKAVKASPFASGTEGSSLWLKIGEKQTLENLTYGLMLKSGNDAAVAIAEYLGGSVDAFALLMNKRAREIGAKNTNFVNPHGLDADGHYTTAYDLALIAREAMKNDTFRKIVSTKTYSIPMEGEKWDRALKNHNKLLWNYDGCNGIKTGFTKKSGRCLVSCAEKNGLNLICVTLNDPNDWRDHKELLDYGFLTYTPYIIATKDVKATSFTYDKENKKNVNLLFSKDYSIALSGKDRISTNIEYKNLGLPLKKGVVAAYMNVYCNGNKIDTIDLIVEREIRKPGFLKMLFEKIRKFFLLIFQR